MKNPLNNSGKIFRRYIWVPYSAAFVCTNTEQQYHQCETNTIDTWTQIQSISRYNDHGVRGTIGLSIVLGDQEPQPPVKSGHSSIWASLRIHADSPEPSLLAEAISSEISCTGIYCTTIDLC